MIRRLSETLLLRPEDLKPLRDDFAVVGVFNPGAVKIDNEIVLLVRVAEMPLERRSGFVGLPRHASEGYIEIDWEREEALEWIDQRVVRRKSDSLERLTSISHLRVLRSCDDGAPSWVAGPLLLPEGPTEEFGIEDPRVTEINGKYEITYVAVSRYGAGTALASTEDWGTFERHGLIYYPENKDVVLFPEKVQGQYVALHRPNPNTHFSRPQIWLARSPDLLHWGQHECLLSGNADWESDRVGAGTPPIALSEGWLTVYHGSRQARRTGQIGEYSAGAVLLERGNPARVLRRTRMPIMQPKTNFERTGFVSNVVFPTALIDRGETLRMYYGAADTFTATVEFSRKEFLGALH